MNSLGAPNRRACNFILETTKTSWAGKDVFGVSPHVVAPLQPVCCQAARPQPQKAGTSSSCQTGLWAR